MYLMLCSILFQLVTVLMFFFVLSLLLFLLLLLILLLSYILNSPFYISFFLKRKFSVCYLMANTLCGITIATISKTITTTFILPLLLLLPQLLLLLLLLLCISHMSSFFFFLLILLLLPLVFCAFSYDSHLENLFFASSPELKGQLIPNLLGSIGVTCLSNHHELCSKCLS